MHLDLQWCRRRTCCIEIEHAIASRFVDDLGAKSVGGTRKIRNTTLTQVTVFDKFSNTVRAQRDCNSPCK
jgi:hypothetical protein